MIANLFSMSSWMMILTAWGSAFLVALWVSLVIWTYRDIRARARDPGTGPRPQHDLPAVQLVYPGLHAQYRQRRPF